MSDEYTEHLSVTMENEPVDKFTNDNVTKVIKENNTRRTQELKRMNSRKLVFLERNINVIVVRFCKTRAMATTSNKQTGIFTCPLSGTYFFSLSILANPGSPTYVHLIVNGQIKANSFAYGTSFSDQGSISSIVRCEAGQNVWIGVYGGTQIYGEYYTSFSGFVLWGDPTGSR
ncbi:hypothetical protein CHS0354_039709 [Potamilus streckersoni]|uniref:C1q domain-containing protein n=1 Tax=Potamilus streckersoni TaxID=2493646 RepID=A0AAE0SEV0_9BIVA|nr:hypothetical protein CHS0354_039709 [Potamilus streckersoni]